MSIGPGLSSSLERLQRPAKEKYLGTSRRWPSPLELLSALWLDGEAKLSGCGGLAQTNPTLGWPSLLGLWGLLAVLGHPSLGYKQPAVSSPAQGATARLSCIKDPHPTAISWKNTGSTNMFLLFAAIATAARVTVYVWRV